MLECTGKFRTRDEAAGHLEAGAEEGDHLCAGQGRRRDTRHGRQLRDLRLSGAQRSSRTHRARPTASHPLRRYCTRRLGIRHGVMTTIHAYTGDQRLVDLPHKDLRRARAGAANIVPTSTGRPRRSVSSSLSSRAGSRVSRPAIPVLTGSIVDLTVEVERATSVAEVNSLFAAAALGELRASSPTARSRSSRRT